MGHLSTLQRSSRAADGTPIHIRMDGPGFDNMDVPDGSSQPKLQFTVFVPSADFFATMRGNPGLAGPRRAERRGDDGHGLERFITAPGARTSSSAAQAPRVPPGGTDLRREDRPRGEKRKNQGGGLERTAALRLYFSAR